MTRRLLSTTVALAIALALASTSALASGTAGAGHPFTLRGAHFSVRGHRLTYMVTICTPGKSVLNVRARFAPVKRARGLVTLTPGTTQYQDHGCWPAFVSTAIARSETRHCQTISCPAVLGHRYRATVTVSFAHPHELRRAPRLQAVA